MTKTLGVRFQEDLRKRGNSYPEFKPGDKVHVLYPLGRVLRGEVVSLLPEKHPYWGCPVYEVLTCKGLVSRPVKEIVKL